MRQSCRRRNMTEEVLSDSEIAELIDEVKLLPINWQASPVDRNGNLQAQADVHGANGTHFSVIVRQSIKHRNDFSVILAIEFTGMRQINLLRYDGAAILIATGLRVAGLCLSRISIRRLSATRGFVEQMPKGMRKRRTDTKTSRALGTAFEQTFICNHRRTTKTPISLVHSWRDNNVIPRT